MRIAIAVKAAAFSVSLAFSAMASAAAYTTLTLPALNTDLTTWSDGGAYSSLFPGAHTLGGIPFALQSDPTTGKNAFVGGPGSIDIKVGVYGATNVYTLINTAWGTMDYPAGSITFLGSAGDTYTVDLVEGVNVRDHFYNVYVNTTSASYVSQVFGSTDYHTAHLDMQNFALPAAFQSQTLTDIVFYSSGSGAGNPFLAGATVAAVPEPETYAMTLAGLALLGAATRRRR